MLSNKLTFSLASLVFMLTLAFVFMPVSVMAHDPIGDFIPHNHPVNEMIPERDLDEDGNSTDIGEAAVPAHNAHPVPTITLKAGATVRGSEVMITTTANTFIIIIDFDRDVTGSSDDRTVVATVPTMDFEELALDSAGVSLTSPTITGTTRMPADDNSRFEATVTIASGAIPTGTAPLDKVTVRLRLNATANANGVFSLETQPAFAAVAGGASSQSNLLEFTLVSTLTPAKVIPATVTGTPSLTTPFTVTFTFAKDKPVPTFSDADIGVVGGFVIAGSRKATEIKAPATPAVPPAVDRVMNTIWTAVVQPTPGATAVSVTIAATSTVAAPAATGGMITSKPAVTDVSVPRTAGSVPAHGYAVLVQADASTESDTGIADDDVVIGNIAATNKDLYEFFRDGGTINLTGPTTANTEDSAATIPVAASLKISEIMWARDAALEDPTNSQWIEVYNTTGTAIDWSDGWDLDFISGLDSTAGVIDRISNLGDPGYWAAKGQTGRTTSDPEINADVKEIVSMYRKLKQLADTTHKEYGLNDGDPQSAAAWVMSARPSRNLSGERVGTPGAASSAQVASGASTIDRSTVYITEIGNSTTDAHDWIEIYNSTSAAVNVKDWIISTVSKAGVDAAVTALKTGETIDEMLDASENDGTLDKELVRFARATYEDALNIPANSYLLVVASDPSDSGNPLSGGIDLKELKPTRDARTNETKGLTALYYVEPKLVIPNGPNMVILRNHHEKEGSPDNVRDIVTVGKYFQGAIVQGKWNTQVWPLQATRIPGDLEDDVTLIAGTAPYVMTKRAAVADHNKVAWAHKDTWAIAGTPGVGYDRDYNLGGTPGYDNGAVKGLLKDLASDAMITISEVMVDAGRNLPQWIELYNSSMTQAVNVKDWRLEIYNYASQDVASNELINVNITLPDAVILPNQTILIVSTVVGRNSGDFPNERVINLYDPNDDPFGRETRRDPILSSTGFRLVLLDADDPRKLADEAGNIDDNRRNADEPDWDLPISSDDERSSLIRRYDKGIERDGTEADAWILASETDLSFAHNSDTYYGNPDDVSTPGFRGGGPLPVSLSSFRPMRDQATGEVVIRWITQSELNNAGFNILRSETKNGEFKVVNLKGIVPGHGTTSEKHTYEWKDTTAKPNVVYYYQIEDVSLDGKRTTLRTTHLRGNVNAAGKVTTRWGELKSQK